MSPEVETLVSEVSETLISPEVSIFPEAPEIPEAPENSPEAPDTSWGKVVGMMCSSSSC